MYECLVCIHTADFSVERVLSHVGGSVTRLLSPDSESVLWFMTKLLLLSVALCNCVAVLCLLFDIQMETEGKPLLVEKLLIMRHLACFVCLLCFDLFKYDSKV